MTEHSLTPAIYNDSHERLDMQVTSILGLDPIVKNAMFFTLLNRDVRMNIYDFLYGWLPPLPYKKRWQKEDDCRGMVLACKQANLELSEAAARHLKVFFDKFSNDFEQEFGHPIRLHESIPLHQGWQALRTVTLTLDISFFDDALAEIALIPEAEKDNWRHHEVAEKLMLDASENTEWRALLFHPFDKVTLSITDASDNSEKGTDIQVEKYQKVIDILRISLLNMGEQIGDDWLMYQHALDWEEIAKEYDEFPPARYFNRYGEYDDTPKRKWYKTAELFRFARVQHDRLSDRGLRYEVEKQHIRGYIRTGQRIQTKQINFAWNFLPSTMPAPRKLVGKKHAYTDTHARRLRITDQLRELKYENQWPHKYEVTAVDGLIGEMGIRHPKRWVLASEEYCEYYGMMGQLKEAEDVESKGIGMALWKAKRKAEKGEGTVEEEVEGETEDIDEDVQEEVAEEIVDYIEEEIEDEEEYDDEDDDDNRCGHVYIDPWGNKYWIDDRESEFEDDDEDEDDEDEDDEDEDDEDEDDEDTNGEDDEDMDEDGESENDDEEEEKIEIEDEDKLEDEDGPGFQPVVYDRRQTRITDFWKKV